MPHALLLSLAGLAVLAPRAGEPVIHSLTDIGHEFIHVHHRNPISHGLQNPDPNVDLVPVCPNCHAMLQRRWSGDRCLSPERLRDRLKHSREWYRRHDEPR